MNAQKKQQRQQLIAQRLNLADRLERCDNLQRVLRAFLVTRPDDHIGAYWPIKGEFDALPALYRWQEDEALGAVLGEKKPFASRRKIALPVVDRVLQTLRFHAWWPGCPMQEDAYNIPKPKDTEVIEPTLLLVPCLGFAPGGFRLGYGGGFYDRTLASLSPKPYTVGLSFANGFTADFQPEPHDIALDAVLTDHGQMWPLKT